MRTVAGATTGTTTVGRSSSQCSTSDITKTIASPPLVPVPFKPHFPRRYSMSAHSWCSASMHHALPTPCGSPTAATGERICGMDEPERGMTSLSAESTTSRSSRPQSRCVCSLPSSTYTAHCSVRCMERRDGGSLFGGKILVSQSELEVDAAAFVQHSAAEQPVGAVVGEGISRVGGSSGFEGQTC